MTTPASTVTVRSMDPAEAEQVAAMVQTAFRESIAPGYSEDGQRDFFEYSSAARMRDRQRHGHVMLVAAADGEIGGMIEVRPPSHIAQLFVDPRHQGKGIAQALVDAAFPESVTARGLTVTVNAPPDAVTTFGRLGFRVIAAEQQRNGIRFVPMIRSYGPVFFPVSVPKFVAMSLGTLGIYPLSCIYWNWRLERDRTGEQISPFWRTCFIPFFLHSLLHRVKREAAQAGVGSGWSVGLITLLTIAGWLAAFLPDPWFLLSLFAFVPFIPVQGTINDTNARVAPAAPRNDRLTTGNIIVLVAGGLLLAFALWGMFSGPTDLPAGTVSV